MYISGFTVENKRKLKRIFSILKENGDDYSFLLKQDSEQLENLLEALRSYRSKIMEDSTFNSYYKSPSYNRNLLLQEACRIILSEYKPGSKRKIRKKSKGVK